MIIMTNNEKQEFDVLLDIAQEKKDEEYKEYIDKLYEFFMETLDPKLDELLKWYKTSDDTYLYDDIIRDLVIKLYLRKPEEAGKFILDEYVSMNADKKEQLKLNI